MSLAIHNVSIIVDGKNIVSNININVPDNKFVGLVGLNGTGKSTLLKAIYGVNKYKGDIFIDGKNIKSIELKEFAKKIAVLIQENNNDFDFKVEDIVMLGRLPYKKLLDNDNAEDINIVDNALKYVSLENFKDRNFNSLSGGEKQRVLIARVLAQQCKTLILDEPTNHLDIKNQFKFFEMIKGLNFTVLSVLHDLNIASIFCDYIYVIDDGKIYTEGVPSYVFTKEVLENVFGMKAEIRNINNILKIDYIGSVR